MFHIFLVDDLQILVLALFIDFSPVENTSILMENAWVVATKRTNIRQLDAGKETISNLCSRSLIFDIGNDNFLNAFENLLETA